MADFKDTEEQLFAKTTDRHLSVTANAGSGKTTVLVDRYINLISGKNKENKFIEPKNIVAITFTKMAASEMTLKIIEKIKNNLDNATSKKEIQDLSFIRTKIGTAKISTIHSFCGNLLREFPLEAGVQPNFSEISSAEQIRIKKSAYFDAITERLNSDNKTVASDTAKLLSILSAEEVERHINNIMDKFNSIENLKNIYSGDVQDLQYIYLNDYLDKIKYLSTLILLKIKNYYNLLSMILDFKKKLKLGDLNIVIQEIETMIESTDIANFENVELIISRLLLLKGKLFTNTDTFRADYKKALEIETDAELIKAFLILDNINNSLKYAEFDEVQFKLSSILIDILEDTHQRYNKEKQNLSALDFNDLIEIANNLLDNREVREKVSSRIEYLLVDEFQDTDELQYNIIKKIIGEFNDIYKKNNLFIVGDAKQSIYGFRNADVKVFRKAIDDIYKVNKSKIECGELTNSFYTNDGIKIPNELDFKFGKLNLTSTFRLKPDIAAFVNYFCSSVFSKNKSEFDVDYEPLVAARNPEVHFNNSLSTMEIEGKRGKVTLLVSIKEKKTESEKILSKEDFKIMEKAIESIPEEEMIAQYILEKCSSGEYSLKDFGILSRNKKKFDSLVKCLINKGIPYINHSGAGFFQAQEIKDIIALLKFIVNPADDLALITILKSSLCGFTDAELFMLSQAKEHNNYWDKLKYFKNQAIENSNDIALNDFIVKANSYFTKISDLIDNKLNMSVPVLINRAVESLSWYAVIAKSPYKFRIESNIEKFVDFAREFINRGFKNIFDFIEELNFIEDNLVGESEAAQITDADAVNLMTIHASKGLEFPVVILMKTESHNNQTPDSLLDPNVGFNFSFRYEKENVYLESVKSSLFNYAKFKADEKERAEEKRILYVALTRAKDELVLSGTIKTKKDGFSYSKDSFLGLLADNFDFESAILKNENEIQYSTKLTVLNNYKKEKVDYLSRLNLVYSANNMPEQVIIKQVKAIEANNKRFLLQPLKGNIEGEFISASRLMTFINNKNEYLEKYILGIPKINLNESQTEKDEDEYASMSATNFGTAVHYAMEHLNSWFDGKSINREALNSKAQIALSNYYYQDKESLNSLLQISEKITKTNLFKRYINQLGDSRHELTLFLPIANDFIQGIVDFVICDELGNYEVWDWKTNQINNNLSETALHYEMQMKLYAYFIYRSYLEQKTFKSRLLFARLADANIDDEVWTYTYCWSRDEMQAFEIELTGLVKSAKNYPFLE